MIDWRVFNGIRNLLDDCDTDVRLLGNSENPEAHEVGFSQQTTDKLVTVHGEDLAEFMQRTTPEEFGGLPDDPSDSVIRLDEVKPGEFGGFTLCYDIAGNPGHAQLETDKSANDDNGPAKTEKTGAVIPLEVPGKATPSVRREPRTRCSCSTIKTGARPTSSTTKTGARPTSMGEVT